MVKTRWTRRRLVLAKLETTIGTDARPQAAHNALKVTDLDVSPLQSDELIWQGLQPYFGARRGIKIHKRSAVRFSMHFTGTGAKIPHYGILLQSCGLSQTIKNEATATQAISYTPTSSNGKSLTLYCNYDGRIHATTGARGTVGIRLATNELPEWQFSFLGHYVRPSLATQSTAIVYNSDQEISLPTTSPIVSCSGKTMTVSRLEVDLGAEVDYIGWINGAQIEMLDRQVRGRMVVRDDDLDVGFWFQKVDRGETVNLSFSQGEISVSGSRVQISDVRYEDVNGIQALEFDLRFLPVSGDDEIAFELS